MERTIALLALAAVLLSCARLPSCRGDDVIFKDDFSGGLDNWFLEGEGKAGIVDGRLCVETITPTVIWIKKEFPGDLRLDFDAMTNDEKARTILMFLARGAGGESIFTWERKGDYCDYALDGKMVLYTIGMLRGFTGGEANLRKLGANTKPEWKKLALREKDNISKEERKRINEDFQKGTIMKGAMDNCRLGKVHHFTCIKNGASIKCLVDGDPILDAIDDGAFGGKPFDGGCIGFRNFGKGTKVFYGNVEVRPAE